MACPVIVDLRNIYRPEDMSRHGFAYACVGRPPASLPFPETPRSSGWSRSPGRGRAPPAYSSKNTASMPSAEAALEHAQCLGLR